MDPAASEQPRGPVKSIRRRSYGANRKGCQIHFMRNILNAPPKARKKELHGRLQTVLDAPDRENAMRFLDQVLKDFENRAQAAIEILEDGFEDATAVFSLPLKYLCRLRTTKGLKPLNEEVIRRRRVTRNLPNRQSVVRLLGALLMDHDEQWSTGARYLDMTEYHEARQQEPLPVTKVTRMRKLFVPGNNNKQIWT